VRAHVCKRLRVFLNVYKQLLVVKSGYDDLWFGHDEIYAMTAAAPEQRQQTGQEAIVSATLSDGSTV